MVTGMGQEGREIGLDSGKFAWVREVRRSVCVILDPFFDCAPLTVPIDCDITLPLPLPPSFLPYLSLPSLSLFFSLSA